MCLEATPSAEFTRRQNQKFPEGAQIVMCLPTAFTPTIIEMPIARIEVLLHISGSTKYPLHGARGEADPQAPGDRQRALERKLYRLSDSGTPASGLGRECTWLPLLHWVTHREGLAHHDVALQHFRHVSQHHASLFNPRSRSVSWWSPHMTPILVTRLLRASSFFDASVRVVKAHC